VSAFVAHDDIEPTKEWQAEIERALFSMDALVALLSEDFYGSRWTEQEVGVAIGRGVPVIPIRLGSDPHGLMGKYQALGGCDWSKPDDTAAKLAGLLQENLSGDDRIFEFALRAYAKSKCFVDSAWNVEHLLSKFGRLSGEQVSRVVEACFTNDQNRRSYAGTRALLPLLEKWTGREWHWNERGLVPVE
jgi:hypothetical protein